MWRLVFAYERQTDAHAEPSTQYENLCSQWARFSPATVHRMLRKKFLDQNTTKQEFTSDVRPYARGRGCNTRERGRKRDVCVGVGTVVRGALFPPRDGSFSTFRSLAITQFTRAGLVLRGFWNTSHVGPLARGQSLAL